MRACLFLLLSLVAGCATGRTVVPRDDAGSSEDDGGGGPSCGVGQIVCGDVCVDPRTDRLNCGGCDDGSGARVCAAGEICSDGVCGLSCGGGTPLLCGDRCIDPTSDAAHCGACGVACDASEVCTSGACTPVCASGQLLCAGACVDTSSDGPTAARVARRAERATSASRRAAFRAAPRGWCDARGCASIRRATHRTAARAATARA